MWLARVVLEHILIAGAVVYHRDSEARAFCHLQGKADLGQEMSGGDQVDIDGTLLLELQENPGEPFQGQSASPFPQGDVMVLAEDALQIAAGEEHRPGLHIL